MKKFFYVLLPVMVALFTLSSCLNESKTDIIIEFRTTSLDIFIGTTPGYDADVKKIKDAYFAEFKKSGLEQMSTDDFVLRNQTGKDNAKSIVKKCAKAAEATLANFSSQTATGISVKISLFCPELGNEEVYTQVY